MKQITFDRWDRGLDVRRGFTTSDANTLRVLDNAYITNGLKIQKRPGLILDAILEPGTVGLVAAGGKLNTFYGPNSVTHSDSKYIANKVVCPTDSNANVVSCSYADNFNGFLYCAVTYDNGSTAHHYLDGTNPSHIADTNCPNSRAVLKMQSKLFAVANDVVRYCKTNAPRDWTTANDAGFLPTGLQQRGGTNAVSLAEFQKTQMAVFFSDGIQLWLVDPDPSVMKIDNRVQNVGTRFPHSPITVGSDIIFLSDSGFRSFSLSAITNNLQDSDVGSPIDRLVKASILSGQDPIAVYENSLGQTWFIYTNYAWVYSFSRAAKLSAWSRYTFKFDIDAATSLDGRLYLRSANSVYRVSETTYTDNGDLIPVRIEFPYLDFKEPGVNKMLIGVDSVQVGTSDLQFKFDPRNQDFITQPAISIGDSRAGDMTAVEVSAVSVAPVITHEANEDYSLDLLTIYYEPLGIV